MTRNVVLELPDDYPVQVALSTNGQNIASGAKKGFAPIVIAGTIIRVQIDCDPANEPSAAAVQVAKVARQVKAVKVVKVAP